MHGPMAGFDFRFGGFQNQFIQSNLIVSAHRPSTIETLLKHMVAMTSHRDQALLDISVIAAMQELIGVTQARVWEIFRQHDSLYFRPRVWISAGEVVAGNENDLNDVEGKLVAGYPELNSCIAGHKSMAAEVLPDGSHRLWLPVWLDDKIATCLEINNPRPFRRRAMPLIKGILDVYRNYQNLLDFSERDSLTGLLNRKTFDERFSKMVSTNAKPGDSAAERQAERRHPAEAQEHWLAVADIDHFKRINDQFGHLYGDEVLILVANHLRASFRSQDRVFRFGGEEFVILLRSASLEEARKIFDRFRANIEEHEFPQIGTVTVSVGFASISDETPVVILGHADQALYYAKANGRNRVCHYDQLVSSGVLQSELPHESAEFFFDQPPDQLP